MILYTTELRWFVPGLIPPEVTTWFDNCPGSWLPQPDRTDMYYRASDTSRLGIKIRQGRLELKERTGISENHRVRENITGWIESWRKWSFELAMGLDTGYWEQWADNFWLAVRKRRQLYLYQAINDDSLMALDLAQGSICQVELTSIEVSDMKWWSLGFEASGVKENQRELLAQIATILLEPVDNFRLLEIDSMGYPEWLMKN